MDLTVYVLLLCFFSLALSLPVSNLEDNLALIDDESLMYYLYDSVNKSPFKRSRNGLSAFILPNTWGPGTLGNRPLPEVDNLSSKRMECIRRRSISNDCRSLFFASYLGNKVLPR